MKKAAFLIFGLWSLLISGFAHAAPSFTADEASKLGKVILASRVNVEFRRVFWEDKPTYDEKKGVWAYRNGWPRTPGGKFYIFEIRESDGHYRLGWLARDRASAGLKRFRIQPSVRRELTRMLKELSRPPNP